MTSPWMRVSTTATSIRERHVVACPEIGPICEERDEPPQEHDQRFTIAEAHVLAGGPLGKAAWEIEVPFRYTATAITYRALSGGPISPDYEDIHHRNETLNGIGDVRLALTKSLVSRVSVAGSVGMWLPTGRTEPNPFALGRDGIEHQHLQFGTGTFDPHLGLDAWTRAGRFDLSASAQARIVFLESDRGYQAGDRYALGFRARTPIGAGFDAGLGFDVAREESERWDGAIEYEGNLGRTDALAGVTLGWTRGPLRIAGDVRVPVYTEASGEQLSYPAIVGFDAGWRFGR